MWSLLQNEWPEQTIDQAKEEIGKNTYSILFHAHFNENNVGSCYFESKNYIYLF